ncbi:hypothetical protein [Nocardioides sp. YIM 152315]|uniref:hypothetical protein n=1 Tax=Nocardioides sp. YIM 152315 TaxID=3031760 RepID=UPI0023DC93DB|nr:hypothetical protein [Nocardioides sp. YIM 152315]MDF1606499.1 hypothetical protein [Nocardioides sp. YIM 152315]
MLNPYVVALAAEEHVNENVPNEWLVGGVTLAILLAMLLALLIFGAGREHS